MNNKDKKDLLFCSTSPEKLTDLRFILGNEFNVNSAKFDFVEIQGKTDDITLEKAKQAYNALKKPLVVEDTCLFFNAFNGLPGPYIKHFLDSLGVHKIYNLLQGFEDKSGYALCTVGYVDEKGVTLFRGRTDGTIVAPRGPTNVGWNSIFEPEGYDKTFAELTLEQKNQVSHRYRAVVKLRNRAVRELPWRSRFEILKERVKPVYMSECSGTPRREYQMNVINGIRIAPTFNPYVKLNKEKRYRLDNWPSRNWDDWNPHACFVRGGRRRHEVPRAFLPMRDELGQTHPPRLSGRYKADIEKQFYFNGLPWVWDPNYYTGKIHYHDRDILFPKVWYRHAYRKRVVEAELKNLEKHLRDYREYFRLKKRYSYFEKAVASLAGEELSAKYIRQRKIPKIS